MHLTYVITGLLSYLLVLASYAFHEFGHVYAYRRHGLRPVQVAVGVGPGVWLWPKSAMSIRLGLLWGGGTWAHKDDQHRRDTLPHSDHVDISGSGSVNDVCFGIFCLVVGVVATGLPVALAWSAGTVGGLILAAPLVGLRVRLIYLLSVIGNFLYVLLLLSPIGLLTVTPPSNRKTGTAKAQLLHLVQWVLESVPRTVAVSGILILLLGTVNLSVLGGDGRKIIRSYAGGRSSKLMGACLRVYCTVGSGWMAVPLICLIIMVIRTL